MLRRRIRSALYIDFENVPLPPDAIANWLSWLEDGAFDERNRARRFLQKRVYWNSHAERNRDLFQRYGFMPILVGKFAGLKNGADIRMAMDVVETTYTRPEIDEFILLTGDSDFVPVLERLRDKAKASAIVVTEHRPNIHTTYQLNADVLIPSRRLSEAAQYRRPRRGLLARMLWRSARPAVGAKTTAVAAPTGSAKSVQAPRPSPQTEAPAHPASEPIPLTEVAARRVAKLLTQQPRNYVAQKRVVAELDRIQGFRRQGPTAFLGAGSYRALMKELARIDPRISVVEQPGGGTGIVFIPPIPVAVPTKVTATQTLNANEAVPLERGQVRPGNGSAHVAASESAATSQASAAEATVEATADKSARAPEAVDLATTTAADAVRRALAAADSMPAPTPYVPIAVPPMPASSTRAQSSPTDAQQPATAEP